MRALQYTYGFVGCFLIFLLFVPLLVFAQPPTIGTTIDFGTTIFEYLLDIGMVAAIAAFLWGMVKFIAKADDPGAKNEGKNIMIWGMIALFVMVAIWAIVGFLLESLFPFGLSGFTDVPLIPEKLP